MLEKRVPLGVWGSPKNAKEPTLHLRGGEGGITRFINHVKQVTDSSAA